MKNRLGNLMATLKGLGVFALCFIMLATMLGMTDALADMVAPAAEVADRDDNIATFGTITYTGLPTDGYLQDGDTFTMAIYVTEENRTTYFDLEKMYLDLPEGLSYTITKPGDEPHILNITIYDHQSGNTQKTLSGEVTIDESGNRLIVTWDKTSEGYPLLEKVTNANYRVELSARVNGSSDVINLDNGAQYYIHNTAQATFTKSFGPTDVANRVKSIYDKNATAPVFKTTVEVAKTGTPSEGEFVDTNGIIRNKETGKIVYVEQEVTFRLQDMTYDSSKKTYYYNIPNLKPNENAGIQITETQSLDLSQYGYTYNANNETEAKTPALVPFSSQTCSLVNNYTQDTGKLTLTKSFYPNTPAITADNITNAQKQSIEIKVTGTTLNGKSYSKTITYDKMTNGSYTINDIPAGSYTVTETAIIDGYRWVVGMYRVDNGSWTEAEGAVDVGRADGIVTGDKEYQGAATMGSVSIGDDESHTVNLQNGYVQKLGHLQLGKSFEGSLTEEQKDKITFYMTTKVNDKTMYVWFRAGVAGSYEYMGLSDSRTTNPMGETWTVGFSSFEYSYFPQGATSLTFLNLPEGTYTITETNADFSGYDRTTTYTIGDGASKKPSNESKNPYYSVEVTDGDITVTNINNKYEEMGSLTVSKQVNGVTLTTAQEKATTFQLQKKTADGKWTDVGSAVTYNSMSSGQYTWKNLEYGEYRVVETAADVPNYTKTTTYTVTENVTGGTTSSSNGTGTTAGVDVINPYAGSTDKVQTVNPATVAFVNTYQPITTDMTISKQFSGNYPLPDDKTELESKIYFQVKEGSSVLSWIKQADGSYKLGSGTGSVTNIPYSALKDGTVHLTGLPVGREYTIVEMGSTLDGYNRFTYVNNATTPVASNTNPSGTVQPTEGHTASTSFTNTYVPVAGLKVEKSFTGVLPDAYCNEEILPELEFVITTEIDGETWYVTDVSGNISKNESDAAKFHYNTIANGVNLQGDRTYTVTEYNREVDDYFVTTWNTVDGTLTSGTAGSVYLAPNGQGLVKFTNRYIGTTTGIVPGDAGTVQSHKTWTGLDNGPSDGAEGAAVKEAVRFSVYRQVGSAWNLFDTYTLGELTSGMTTYKVLNEDGTETEHTAPIVLPIGNYKLVETNADYPGYIHKATVSVLYDYGENVQDDPRNKVDIEMTSAGVEFAISGGDVVTFSIANVYYPLGKLTVTKAIDPTGDLTSLDRTQRGNVDFGLFSSETPNTPIAEFDLNGVSGSQNPYNIKVENNQRKSFTITMENLPIGYFRINETTHKWELVRYQYTVKEMNSIADYNCTTTVTIDKSQSAGSADSAVPSGTVVLYKLSADESANVAKLTFSNKYMRQNGALKVTKAFELGQGLTDAQKKQVTFQILNSDKDPVSWNNVNGQHVYSANGTVNTFTYGDMTNGEYVVTGLPTGIYYVVETNANFDPFLRTTHFTVTNGNGTTSNQTTTTEGKSNEDESPKVTITSDGNSTVAVKNTYRSTGSLTLTKTYAFEGNAAMSETLRKSIVFTLKQGDNVIASGSLASPGVTYDDATKTYSYTFTDLPVGQYTIIESNADPSGYVRTTTVVVDGKTTVTAKTAEDGIDADNGTPSAEFDIAHGENQAVQFTNTYAEYGTLTIIKGFTGLDDAAFASDSNWDPTKIVFAVRSTSDPNTILPDSNGNHVVVNGQTIGTVTYAQLSGSAILTLPAGTYTVEEIILDESNNIVDTDSLFYGYVHDSTDYVITVAGTQGSKHTTTQGDDGEVGSVQSEGFRVGAGNSSITFTNNYTKVDLLQVEKNSEAYPVNTDAMNVEDDLPVWAFNVTIKNLSDLNTVNGETTLFDTFDVANKDWFKLYTAPGYEPKITAGTGGMVKSYKDNGDGTAEFVISVKDANGVAAGESITLTYYLQVEDKNALAALTASQSSISNPNAQGYGTATWTFTNTIQYRPRPMDDLQSDTSSYYYALSPIRKTMATEVGSPIVTFTLDINPDAIHIGTEQYLTIYDKMSDNVQVDMLSFKIEPASVSNQVSTDKYSGSGDWDLVITVPNDVHVKITYTGTILETGNAVAVSNQASLYGVNAVVEDTVNVAGDSDGTASIVQILLLKRGEGNYNERLEGAKFCVYAADDTDFSDPLGTYITDSEGIARIADLDDKTSIKENVRYALKEVEAPVGYQINETPIYFTITTDVTKVDPEADIYLFNSLLDCPNTPMSTKVAFEGVKTLSGRALEADQFQFGLYDANGYLLQTVSNDAAGKVTFAEIEYTYREIRAQQSEDGTATINYTIKEIVPNNAAPGYTYDTNAYPVIVTLSLNDDETALVADVTYPAETGLTFTNSYAAEGSATISGTKTVTGATKIRETFAFTIKDGDDTICAILTPTGGDGDKVSIPYPTFKYVVDPAATAGTAYDAANKVITVTVNSAADLAAKTYTIAEVSGENAAYTYDSSTYTLTVSATDNGNGELTVTPVLTKNGETAAAADFTNVYTGSLNIKKNVTVGGLATDTTLADGAYSFEVYSDEACTKRVDACSITITNGQSSTATISGLAPATYYVKEVSGTNANVTLVSEAKTVTVSGDATAAVPTAEFTNHRGIGLLTLSKSVEGTNATDKVFTFKVTIEDAAGLTFMLENGITYEWTNVTFDDNGQTTVTMNAGELLTFLDLPAGADYTVEEINLPAGYTVKEGNTSTGTIKSWASLDVDFTNAYKAEGSTTITGTKTVTGATKIHETFTFEIKVRDETVYTMTTATSADGNTVSIPYPTFKYVVDPDATAGVTYDEDNEIITVTRHSVEELKRNKMYCTISEKNGGNASYNYDSTVYELTITVLDNGDGTLSLGPILTKDTVHKNQADFTNVYTGSLKIQKNVTVGGTATTTTLADGTYGFEVYSDATCTTSVAECSITVTNGQSSTATISGLVPATYYVKEVSSTNTNVTLVPEAKTVTVSGDATADVETAVFTNDRGVGYLGLSKRVYGTAADDKEFTFRVTIPEVAGLTFNATNNGNSTRVTFNENGQLTVTLKADEGLTILNLPSGAAYTVEEIDLPAGYTSQDGNTRTGTIKAGYQTIWSWANVYAAQGSATISGTKTVTGATKIREAFAFTIKDSDDSTICTILTATGGDGDKVSIPYPTFKYVIDRDATAGTAYDAANKVITVTVNSAADLAAKTYTISEVSGENGAYTFDSTVYTLTVTPADNGDGTLTVSTALAKGEAAATAADFTNVYTGSLKIQKNVTVGGTATTTTLADGTYGFEVYSDEACTNVVRECSITITNGQSSTETISGLAPATYYVKEISSTNANVQLMEGPVSVVVSGDAEADVETAAFTNNRGMGELMLKKTVTGTNAADKEFTFMVIVDAAAGMTYPATYNGSNQTQSVTFDSNGKLEVTLKANDTLIISNLPEGSPYTVSETDLPEGYTATTIEGAIGSISGNATAAVTQTNAYAAQGSATISGTKTLTNATIIRDAFEFEIKDGTQTVYTAVTATDVEGNKVSIPYPTFKYVVDPAATAGTTYDATNKVITVTVNSAADLAQKVYTISEKTAANTPYTYDESVYTLTVTPTDNGNGKLTVTASLTRNGETAAAADFTNIYTGSLKIQKNVTVGDTETTTTLADGTYVFKVYSDAECTNEVKECSITITNGQSNTATISGLTPAKYYVKEVSSTNTNVTLVPEAKTVTVSSDATAEVETAEFTNNRGVGFLSLYKSVEGTNATDKVFTFKVTIEDAAGLTFTLWNGITHEWTDVTFDDNGQTTVTMNAGENLFFLALPAGADYTVEEINLPAGYTIKEGNTSTGTIKTGVSHKVHFTNTYKAQGSDTISGVKTAAGASMIREAFTFEIKDGDQTVYTAVTENNVEGSTVSIPYPTFKYVVDPAATAGVTYDADNAIITVTVNSAADLAKKVYTISEKKGENLSYTYDDSVYTLTVTPTDNGDGTLTVTPVLTKGEETADAADFTNIYTGSLKIQKNVTVGGLATTTTLADGTYNFKVYSDEACTTSVAECSITITNGQSSTAAISDLTPATYYVKEVASTNVNVTLLAEPVAVTVSGDANVAVKTAEFTNNLGVGSLMLMKTVTGTEAADKEFTFVVTVEMVAGMTYPAEHSANAELTTVAFDETGKVIVTLKANETMLIKDLPNGAAYTVEEIDLPAGYASTNGDTTEGVIASDATATVIHDNTYTAYGEADLLVNKQVADYTGDGTFTFTLCDEEGTEIDTATCGANETAAFTTIGYQLPGTYHYTITEVTPELADRVPGMQYNSDTCYATVTVTDNGDGTLTAVVTYGTTEEAVTEESLTITNVYDKPEGTAELSVTKALTGNIDAYTADEDFIFELAIDEHELTSETNNVLMPIDETETEANAVAMAKVGEQAFWKLKYDEPGTYTYTITEVEGATPGMIYDTSAHTVTVIVEYTEDLMALKTSVIYVTEEDEPDADEPGTDDPTVDDPTTDDPTTDDPTTDDPTVDEPNTDDPTAGDSDVDALDLDDPTTDDPTTDDPTTDDPTTDDPTTDDPDVDDPDVDDPDVDGPEADDPEADVPVTTLTITNKYGEISYQPMIKKIVDGTGAPDETFTFTLTDGEGYEETASCKAGETAMFSEIVYHAPGTYTYTVTENTPDRQTDGMTYSKQVVTITVTVVSAEDGTLEATAEYTDEGTITNKFVPPPKYDYKFSFTKKWSGGVEGSIEWTLYNPDGSVAHKKFNKKVISETEWSYEAWFMSDKDYYIIEDVPEGYTAIYVNVGKYADVTDRLYNGGTIINKKIPKTGDSFDPLASVATLVVSSTLLATLLIRNGKRKRSM